MKPDLLDRVINQVCAENNNCSREAAEEIIKTMDAYELLLVLSQVLE
jgi:hypothetical protein